MKKDGFYTVEAALVMPFIMMILAAMLYVIFFIHDREMIQVYLRRMAQETCYLVVEKENYMAEMSDQDIIHRIQEKYSKELQSQMLMLQIDGMNGTCKKNLLTHVYTATWNVTASPQVFVDVGEFIGFKTVICQESYERVHGRGWMYAYDLLKGEFGNVVDTTSTGIVPFLYGSGS